MNTKLTKRELIQPHLGDKRFVRRVAKGQEGAGQFAHVVNVHKSLSDDDRRKARNIVKEGQGDRGDENRHRDKRK